MKAIFRKAFPALYHFGAKLFSKTDAWQQEKRRLMLEHRYRRGYSMILGKPFLYSDNLSFIASFEEIFKQQQYHFKAEHDYPRIIDIGANTGLSVLFFKELYPLARITALEPDPYLFDILESNIKRFGHSEIQLHNVGVWKDEGLYSFVQDFGTGGRISTSDVSSVQKIVEVTMRKLSDYLQEPVDLLKIDVEGAEWDCIRESEHLLKNVECLIIEHHTIANEYSTLHELLATLQLHGFRYYIRETFCPRFPLDSAETNGHFDLQVNIFANRKN